ncbi:MAG: hypothetical protein WCW14_01930 [Candidatus Paceibacterota bacterium]
MKYDKECRKAVGTLSSSGRATFEVLEKSEQGEFVAFPELCSAINKRGQFLAFSCLSGSATDQELGSNLGGLFIGRITKVVIGLLDELKSLGYEDGLTVILDDCEPRRVWQWSIPQEDVTTWYQMVIEDNKDQIPTSWKVLLWSEIEAKVRISYEEILTQVNGPNYALIVHQQLEHVKKFPNKKLLGDVREAVLRRVAEYSLQGKVLEGIFPTVILIQTETPWRVKDPLYSPLRQVALPIIHPYPEERR